MNVHAIVQSVDETSNKPDEFNLSTTDTRGPVCVRSADTSAEEERDIWRDILVAMTLKFGRTGPDPDRNHSGRQSEESILYFQF